LSFTTGKNPGPLVRRRWVAAPLKKGVMWNTVFCWRQVRYHTQGIATSHAGTGRYLRGLKREPGLGFVRGVQRAAAPDAAAPAGGVRGLLRRRCPLPQVRIPAGRGSKQRGSNDPAKAKAARAHRKVAASRADLLHKTTRLVRDHDSAADWKTTPPAMVAV
jgi:hypothetical protein